jgi:hypothetical protein
LLRCLPLAAAQPLERVARRVVDTVPERRASRLLVLRRLELAEERDRALLALKELEFDHRTGKLSDDDYRAVVGEYRRRAAAALRALDPSVRARNEERVNVAD